MSKEHFSKGGKARAQKLSAEERSRIASEAALSRWSAAEKLPKATHRGSLEIGSANIPCAVLEDGTRVISEHGITSALGSRSGASKRISKAASEGGVELPIFLAPSNIREFVLCSKRVELLSPVRYRDGRRVVNGFDARALPAVCDIWLEARAAGALQAQQQDRAFKAEVLLRALADVAIWSLVDDATGYTDERDRSELNRLLEAYLSSERLAWAKRFPDEFYRQMYRLRGWSWPAGRKKTPLVGKLTNKVVYERLPDGVLDELRVRNPTEPGTGRRKWKHHQFLSEDIGQPDLRDHLLQVIALMRISKDWKTFERHLDAAFPRLGTQIELELESSR